MTDKELMEAVVAGEIKLEDHPEYRERLESRLSHLIEQQKKMDQPIAEAMAHDICSLEDLLQ